jgi:hypothetical protein
MKFHLFGAGSGLRFHAKILPFLRSCRTNGCGIRMDLPSQILTNIQFATEALIPRR